MDLSRLLSHQSDDSDDGAVTRDHDQSTVSAIPHAFSVRLLRRRAKLDKLREQVRVLEWFASNGQTHDGEDHSEVAANTDDARMRRFLGQSRRLQRDTTHELRKRVALVEQLRQLQESSSSIRKLMRGVELSGWFWKCERWRAIAAECYKPFSPAECERFIDDTVYGLAAYSVPKEIDNGDKPSVFGWRDARGVGKDSLTVHYQSQKTICGSKTGIDDVAAICWSVFNDADLFREMMVSHHSKLYYNVLQHITPDKSRYSAVQDMVIVQLVEDHPELPTKVHSVNVVMFMKTPNGYRIAFRSLESPDLQRAMRCEGMNESSVFYWSSWDATAWDQTTGECVEFVTRAVGFLKCCDPAYARKWVLEGILVYVRLEAKLYGTRPLITLPPS